MEPRIQYAKTEDGVSIAFWTLGEGMPLVHSPLVPFGHMQLEWQMEEVRRWYESLARGRMLVGYDRRGTGLSDRDIVDYSLDAQVLDLEAIVERLGIKQFALFAGLYLGPAAIAYAARHRDKVTHLLLWCTSPGASKRLLDARFDILDPLMETDWKRYTETRVHWTVGWDDPQLARKYAALLREGSTAESFRAYQRASSEFDASDLLKDVQAPTLVLHMSSGPRSALDAARQLASQIPDARLTAVEGSRPYPWMGSQESALTAIDEFLGEARPAAAPPPSASTASAGPAVADVPRQQRSGEPAEPQVQYAKTSDGMNIAYYTMGQGPPFVSMILPSHLQAERKLLPDQRRASEAIARMATLVRYDHRGFGLSDRDVSAFPLDALVSDLEAVVDKLGLATFVLYTSLGYSAPIALSYAAKHPERVSHLVLSMAFARMPAQFHQQVQALLLSTSDWRFVSESVMRLFLGWEDEEQSRAMAAFFRESGTFETFKAFWRDAGQWDVRDLLPNVGVPTLVVNMVESPLAGAEQSREVTSLMPDARAAIADGKTTAERQPQYLAAVASFLGLGAPPAAATAPYSAAATAKLPTVAPLAFAAGRYTVTRLLGEGAQKTVYLVRDTALERDCALALLKTEVLDADGLARVRREGQAMARLTHPNVVGVYDIGDEDGRPYLVCEYVSGGDLRQELDRAGGPLPLPRAVGIAQDLCRALAFAHRQGIIHRDVKPGNVHLAADGSAKLGDFGLALAADQSRLTMPGMAMGTAPYMAPEQARGEPVDARSDLYSLGCLLYELVAGRPPFTGDDPMAVVSQHVHAVPEPPSKHNAEVSHDVDQLVLALLAKAREERPSTADEVLAALQRIAAAG